MSKILDKLMFFGKERFAGDHGLTTGQSRQWEDKYRNRWRHDKIVRSTHGVNCTGSCSWKIYVKDGLVCWETQQTDYPETRQDLPNHEPRGCPRGASYSWYLYSAARVKYPLVRSALLKAWRKARGQHKPVEAWASIVEDPLLSWQYKSQRGKGGFVRLSWEEANEIIAAANIYTIKKYGPDRIIGFSPIPAMSMVSYAAGSRYLSLIGGVAMSFYDFYCDLPASSPQTWGEQTDVPESADWYNSGFIIAWGANVPQTRTPDAHFMTEARYKGTPVVTITPDFSEASKFADLWLAPRQGTDAALALAFGHVILKEFYVDRQVDYFNEYAREKTDLPMLVRLEEKDGRYVPTSFLRAKDFTDNLGERNNPEWKTVALDEISGKIIAPRGSIGFRWGEKGLWNTEQKTADGTPVKLRFRLAETGVHDSVVKVSFPYFGTLSEAAGPTGKVRECRIPAVELTLSGGKKVLATTVFELLLANYGVDQGFGGDIAASFEENAPYTPDWAARVSGVKASSIIKTARAFARNAEQTRGRSMVILGAGLNHWYHMDMSYRGIINMLVLTGCVGQSGGGWAHYVGQEKLRPQAGWLPVAFALDWQRPPRQMNSTSFFYAHTDQYRYETLQPSDMLSPLADRDEFHGSLIDFNVRAERMGWLPSAPQLAANPLDVVRKAEAQGLEPQSYVVESLKNGSLRFACENPDSPENFPRNLFVWRSNLLGASAKGHEYFLKHLLGARHGLQGKDLQDKNGVKPEEVVWHEKAPEGKLDLLVTLDFRMSSTCMYSDLVLPTATWYEKNDLNTSDMHPFIHPLQKAVDPGWQTRSDWEIFRGICRKFSELAKGYLGKEKDIVLVPILHDTPFELAQPMDVREWKKGQCEPVPGKTMPNLVVVERDYPNTFARYSALGPMLSKLGNAVKGLSWQTGEEVKLIGGENGLVAGNGLTAGLPRLDTDVHVAQVILALAPETNGQVAVKAWQALSASTGRKHAHLAEGREHERITFKDIVAQPRKIISTPTWSGIESENVSYNAGWTNVHELIPWRTLTGRQQLYQDHSWMRAFGESLVVYKPPVDTGSIRQILGAKPNGNPEKALNFITPHQKWGIHSTYSDNLIMLTLSRGGPCVWLSESDARQLGIADNDWVEVFNVHGALAARAIVSQRIPDGVAMMYHAQEKTVNTPGTETSRTRGIHNSVTRICPKPTHMIGGYGHLSWGFNYYGTVGSNRDETVIVRKMSKIDWMDQ